MESQLSSVTWYKRMQSWLYNNKWGDFCKTVERLGRYSTHGRVSTAEENASFHYLQKSHAHTWYIGIYFDKKNLVRNYLKMPRSW